MKPYKAAEIRNFSIVGHQSVGKTLLTEAMLVSAGVLNRMGSITAGTTASDYHDDEKSRQISIHTSLMHLEWDQKKFNIMDTPGYLDFISESLGALRVSDFALIVVDAVTGTELGTSQVWEFASRFDLPKAIVINGFDKEHTRFDEIMLEMEQQFGARLFPMNIPINPGPGFNLLLDVIRTEICAYSKDFSGKYDEIPASGDWETLVKKLHHDLVEFVAETDDTLMEKFFENDGLTLEELRASLHNAIKSRNFIPVFCTSALNNIGVCRFMDFIAKYGSNPVDATEVKGFDDQGKDVSVALTSNEPCAFVFKTMNEAHVGELSFFRVYSGDVHVGMDLHNSSRNTTERIGQLFSMNGKNRDQIDTLFAGDIGAAVKLKDTHTGNTLCSQKKHVAIPAVKYPEPNIFGALVLKSKGDEDKIAAGLSTIREEDPSFQCKVHPETGQTLLGGQGELHLQVVIERLKQRYNLEVDLAEPRIPFRETIKSKADSKYRHKKQSGGSGQFAEVWLRIEPAERDSGIDFKQSLVGQNVDRVFVPSVEKGILSACKEGILAGYPIVDVKIDFYDGKMHPVDSKDVAFQIAGKEAFREAFNAARPCLLEPIMEVSIKIPESYMGDVMGDISSRRGKILGIDMEGQFQIVKALVPQMELYRYSTKLRSLTGGRGLHTESLSHYEELQRDTAEKVIAAAAAAKHHHHE
jgi:elongation factor G